MGQISVEITAQSGSALSGNQHQDEIFPVLMVDAALRLGVLVATGEFDRERDGNIAQETVSEMLRLVCLAHDWAQNIMRAIDWLAIFLTHRCRFRGIDSDRLRMFAKNFDENVEDHLDLTR